MKKESSNIDKYNEEKAFLGFYFDNFLPSLNFSPENHPISVLEELEKKSMSQARKGLEMAIHDVLEMTSHMALEQVAKVDSVLVSHAILSLTKMRVRYSRKYASVLKRGRINNDVEYYLLKGIADDAYNELELPVAQKTQFMIEEYEKAKNDGVRS
ncbi:MULTISPECIES: hypothetical protein [Methylomonas]|uniref:Uncharacterized protein n=1 Tax=Methylomonas koyamae TaxID=702114 RepID=A0A177P4K9_9GAMM|nr:hypothetical protein [Methylomonas koyamae]OAI24403.1 hypothetical protein A1355_20725 [Methylomonas koyamae]